MCGEGSGEGSCLLLGFSLRQSSGWLRPFGWETFLEPVRSIERKSLISCLEESIGGRGGGALSREGSWDLIIQYAAFEGSALPLSPFSLWYGDLALPSGYSMSPDLELPWGSFSRE